MSNYYVFDRNSDPGRWIAGARGDNNPRVDWYYWRKGAFIPKTEVIPDPIKFSLKPQVPGHRIMALTCRPILKQRRHCFEMI